MMRKTTVLFAVLLQMFVEAALVVETCIGSDQFLIFDDLKSASDATASCADLGGTLGRVSSLEEYESLLDHVTDLDVDRFRVGISDKDQVGDQTTERFTYDDGVNTPETLKFIQTALGAFPWTIGEPNANPSNCGDPAGCPSDEFCVDWMILDDNTFNDASCSNEHPYLCRRAFEACTISPTSVPTVKPTHVPTDVPTSVPSIKPTPVPTDAPTETPIVLPTFNPTHVPSDVPTEVPSIGPTTGPTNRPNNQQDDQTDGEDTKDFQNLIIMLVCGTGSLLGVVILFLVRLRRQGQHSRTLSTYQDLLDLTLRVS